MSKSILYAANSNTQTLSVGNSVDFGSVIRQYGNSVTMDGNIVLNERGYYDIDTNFTIAGSAAGTAIITLCKDGVAIPGANASVVTTTTSVESITIPCVVRQKCCCESSITATITGTGAGITNASIVIEKE